MINTDRPDRSAEWSDLNIFHRCRARFLASRIEGTSYGQRIIAFILVVITIAVLLVIVKLIVGNIAALEAFDSKKGLVDSILQIVSIAVTAFMGLQIFYMKDASQMEVSNFIYEADKNIRIQDAEAEEEYQSLIEVLLYVQENYCAQQAQQETSSDGLDCPVSEYVDYHSFYNREEYKTVRSFAYHYEYIGYLVLRKKLNFPLIFDTISFPDWMITTKGSEEFLTICRSSTADFWNGAEFLYKTYLLKRKYNACKYRGGSKAELKKARAVWYKCYRNIPK